MVIRHLALSVLMALIAASGAMAQTAPASGPADPTPLFKGGGYVMRDGGAIYTHLCQGCHMADAKGAVGAGTYPALARNPRLAGAAYPIIVIVKGQKAMPPFGGYLDDRQIAEVVTYVRTHFGNSYTGAVTPADVKRLRERP